jgi:hypothetical protein
MSIFDRLDRMASKAVDRINAIGFTLTPMVSTPNGRPQQDLNRPVIAGKGIFDYFEAEYGIELGVRKSYRESNDLRALQSGREPLVSIDRKYFPTLASEPQQGDIIAFDERANLPRFEVVSAKRDGQSRMMVQLVHKGRQA